MTTATADRPAATGTATDPATGPGTLWQGGDDPRTLRRVLGHYPTGVAIVSTRDAQGRPVGLTINSFASLSMTPPLVLWSLVSHSPSLVAFQQAAHFAVQVLAHDQQALARRFATPGLADKFDGVALDPCPEGLPLIKGALATLVCASERQLDGGDHCLMLGRVLRAHALPAAPLVFHAGGFTALAGLAACG